MVPNLQLVPAPADHIPSPDEKRRYLQAVGSLMYAMLGTRPDIAHAVGVLGRHSANSGPLHWAAVVHVLRYLKGTLDYGLEFNPDNSLLTGFEAYSDLDWAEYIGLSHASKEAVFLSQLLGKLGYPLPHPTTLFGDNQGANALSRDPQFHNRNISVSMNTSFGNKFNKDSSMLRTFLPSKWSPTS
ncbi:Ty1/Copia family ribonuclease HI [Sporobolomyces salmoneus]|uniref:Ty1/Copia family ribonuclease HI n=1 Tax=Sporobolomyces salmoneus TaxID=183962 RepID=UPI003174ADA3